MELMTVEEAASYLDLSVQRIRQLLASGTLPAQKVGRDWVIAKGDVARLARKRKAQR